LVQLPVILIAGALGVWLFYVQRTFEHAYWSRQKGPFQPIQESLPARFARIAADGHFSQSDLSGR